MAAVNQSIHDGISQSRVMDKRMPVLHWHLASHNRGARADTVIVSNPSAPRLRTEALDDIEM